jgi:hypothetical protein
MCLAVVVVHMELGHLEEHLTVVVVKVQNFGYNDNDGRDTNDDNNGRDNNDNDGSRDNNDDGGRDNSNNNNGSRDNDNDNNSSRDNNKDNDYGGGDVGDGCPGVPPLFFLFYHMSSDLLAFLLACYTTFGPQ